MESDQGLGASERRIRARVPLEWIGEGLLLASVLTAPWVYGAVEDTVRYFLCAVVLLGSGLFLWPDLRANQMPRGLGLALALPGLALAQVLLGQTLGPILTLEAALVGFAFAVVWAVLDSRTGSASTHSSRRFAWALLIVCASESAFAAFQWSTDRTALFGQKNELQTMPFGSYVNHNNFAGLVSLGVPLAIAMAIGDVRRSGKLTPRGLGLVGLAGGLAIAVLASGSRGAAVALLLGLVILATIAGSLLQKHHRRPSWFAPLAIGAVILGLALLAVPTGTRGRLLNMFQGGSVSYRVDIALASAKAFASRPILGSGLGAFSDAATPFKAGHGDVRSERAEADLIEFAVEGGLVLTVGLLLFGRFVWRSARREMLHGRDRSGRWLRAGALSACATMLFHSLFDFGFRIPANALAFAVLLGLATAGSASPGAGRAWVRYALVGVLSLAALAAGYRSLGAAGERAALARTTPESRLDALEGLVAAHPYLDRARRQRGLAWMALAYNRGRYDATRLQRARADLEAVVMARPQWGEARADLGWLKYYAGEREQGAAELAHASRLDPTHMGIGIGYAQVLAWSGNTLGAVNEITRLRRINPAWSRSSAQDLASSWTKNALVLSNIP